MNDRKIVEQAIQIPDEAERVRLVEQGCQGESEPRRKVEDPREAAAEQTTDLPVNATGGDCSTDRARPRDPGPDGSEGAIEMTCEYPSANGSVSMPSPGGASRQSDSGTGQSTYRVGQTVAGFMLLKEIGAGGFGQVFASEDTKLGRRVAVKLLNSKALAQPESHARFLNEARALAAVTNDYVVPILQIGQDGDTLFLVMPLLAGETLQAKLERDGIVPLSEFFRLVRELGLGLAAIHAKGLIHRDLKPANVWLEAGTGRVKILDFGLADAVTNLRRGGSAGTPAYMSPEQINGEPLDFRSDLFSLGAILYECLTACKAFPGTSFSETIHAVLRGQPLPLEQANPAVPKEVRQLVTAMLEKDRGQRPVSVHEMLAALPPLQPQDAGTSSAVLPQPPQDARRHWPLSISFALAAVALAAFAGWRGLGTVVPSGPSVVSPKEPVPLAKLTIESIDVTPIELLPDGTGKDLLPLNQALRQLVTTTHSIDVKAKLSRPGYSYIVLYRSDGEAILLYPYRDDEIPPLTDQANYPPPRKNVAYQLNDGPGIWAVSVIASESPLPSFRDWQAGHPAAPWTAQTDPTALASVVIDDGVEWSTATHDGGLSRGSRGEISLARRVPIEPLLDYWQEAAKAAVKVIAFPVTGQ